MQYLGGKARIAKDLGKYLNERMWPNQKYWEPFCGSCWVAAEIKSNRRFCSDAHPDLILLWKALQDGWIPPDTVSEEQYKDLKKAEPSAMRGFTGFACSNSGKWFGGYARSKDRNYAANGKSSLLKKIEKLKDVHFACGSYDQWNPVKKCLIYCDPPYRNTTGYSLGSFDSDKFWEWVRGMSRENTVLVSEYSAPDDFQVSWSIETKTDMKLKDGAKENRTEKLFEFKGSTIGGWNANYVKKDPKEKT